MIGKESYWQRGCTDSKEGRPYDPDYRNMPGYENGYEFGCGNPRKLDTDALDGWDDWPEPELCPHCGQEMP